MDITNSLAIFDFGGSLFYSTTIKGKTLHTYFKAITGMVLGAKGSRAITPRKIAPYPKTDPNPNPNRGRGGGNFCQGQLSRYRCKACKV